MRDKLSNFGNEIKKQICGLSDFMFENPELGNQEFKACEALTKFLKENGFDVTTPAAGIATAFSAVYDSGRPGKSVAFLCEYDALPEIGHGCGHNMIGAIGVGAGAILSKAFSESSDIGGKVYVFGTPAEETNGGKVGMTEQGLFNEMDAVIMVHPSKITRASGSSLAIEALQFVYKGKTAHASGCPEEGINALNSAIHLFTGIDALRQHVTPDVRMHGIIAKGGVAANIVPDEAIAQFYLRAATKEYLAVVKEKVLNIANAAALMTGATLTVSNYELSNDDLKTNPALSEAFNNNLRSLGIEDIKAPTEPKGSSDIGNVSNVAPTIHPYIAIVPPGEELVGHSVEMAKATTTDLAHERLLIAALASAYTGLDVLENKIATGKE